MLFHISDGYFGESLRSLSKILKISDEFSAVTLLSFANGAPDLFTALAAPEASDATVSLNALFLLCIVLGTALLLPEPVKRASDKKLFEIRPFLRSCAVGFLGLATLCVLPWFSAGKKLAVPLVMIAVFGCYIFWIAVFNSKQQRAQPQSPIVVTAGDNAFSASRALDQISLLTKEYFKADLYLPFRLFMLPAKIAAAFTVLPGRYSLNGKYGLLQRSVSQLAAFIGVHCFFRFIGIDKRYSNFVRFLSWFLGLVFSWFISLTMNNVGPGGKPRFFIVHSLWTFIMSILWMYKCSDWLLGVLRGISAISSLKMVPFLLAAVNGMGDLATNASLVRQGKFSIVGTSIFSSVIQNILLVLPICMIMIGQREGSKAQKMESEPFISFCALAVLLIVFLVVFPLGKGKVSRLFGGVLIGIWGLSVGGNQLFHWWKSRA